jgi:hypothetical protein
MPEMHSALKREETVTTANYFLEAIQSHDNIL